LSFIINTVVGSLLLLLGIISLVVEFRVPLLRGDLALGFLPGAVICLAIGVAHRRKYLSLMR
jgi:hypothetical protein